MKIDTTQVGIKIGDYYQGGIVCYIDVTGKHGLIAAPSDQSEGTQWWNGSYIIGGFEIVNSSYYWGSSEVNYSYNVWGKEFTSDGYLANDKNKTWRVRAVRAF